MNLHEVEKLKGSGDVLSSRLKVPGGWIYYSPRWQSGVFVPEPQEVTGKVSFQAPSDKPKNLTGGKPAKKPEGSSSSRMKRPSPEEVQIQMIEKGLDKPTALVESEKFWDFYESKGWKVGKNPMKSWKSAVNNWLKGVEKNAGNNRKLSANEEALRAKYGQA